MSAYQPRKHDHLVEPVFAALQGEQDAVQELREEPAGVPAVDTAADAADACAQPDRERGSSWLSMALLLAAGAAALWFLR